MRHVATVGVMLGALALMGCAPSNEEAPEPGPQITLQEARQFQNQVLLDLGEYVPAGQVSGGFDGPIERMSAMKCDWMEGPALSSKDSGVFLPGGFDIEVLPETDLGVVFDQILDEYENSGWTVASEGSGTDRELELISPDGYTIYLTIYDSDTSKLTLAISSFSPCIKAPEDFDIFEQY